MKKQLLQLVFLFGFLAALSIVFPYEHPCETNDQEQTVLDTKKVTNLAKYTGVENSQVARFESGAPYNVQIENSQEPCINCNVDREQAAFLDQLETAAFERMQEADLYQHKPPSIGIDNQWSKQQRTAP